MASGPLATYLNDHLAGAVAGLEMLSRLAEAHGDLVDVSVLHRLRRDIEDDRATLESLMSQLGIVRSRPRRFMGWLAERATHLKLLADDPNDGALRAFEMVELISLGIEGKIELWHSLATIGTTDPTLRSVNYEMLMERGREQRRMLAPLHAATAAAALLKQASVG